MEDGKLVGKGVAFKLLQFLMDKYNFSYEIVKHDRNIIGSQEDFNGSLLQSLNSNVRNHYFSLCFFFFFNYQLIALTLVLFVSTWTQILICT